MGMVVSAAVSAIPMVEQEEQQRSQQSRHKYEIHNNIEDHHYKPPAKPALSQYHPSRYSPPKKRVENKEHLENSRIGTPSSASRDNGTPRNVKVKRNVIVRTEDSVKETPSVKSHRVKKKLGPRGQHLRKTKSTNSESNL